MPTETTTPRSQEGRAPCSLPLPDADLSLGNANWAKGLQAMSDWIWSGHLNPVAFPNNLARYFLQIPGIFEQQLNFSTTLIFDEPSFRNGVQISGFVARPTRELVINLIAQRRRCWYSMTHHAILGTLTAQKHNIPAAEWSEKLVRLLSRELAPAAYTPLERAVLDFADAFSTNPKAYSDRAYRELREALAEENRRSYPSAGLWMAKLDAARAARAEALLLGDGPEEAMKRSAQAAASAPADLPDELNERLINAQIVELAFLSLQFVALTDVFTALNIPDEPFLPGVMEGALSPAVIARINELNELGGEGMAELTPPPVELPIQAIEHGAVRVDPARLKGARIPLVSYEGGVDRDKGLTVGGVQVGVYGWSFGAHFPGSLPYALMHHPELARYEAPYSLPLLFNEDEWRNGAQTAGFVTRRLKEIAILKVYTLMRSRYGLEHHTMFLYNTYLDEHGVGRPPAPELTEEQRAAARRRACERAEDAVLNVLQHRSAAHGVYTPLEVAVMTWIERIVTAPHGAHEVEADVRQELDRENRREVAAGLRRLDASPGIGQEAAYKRLEDHQVAELAMVVGHMDGLARALTILRLESEDAAAVVKGVDRDGKVALTGAFNDRPALLDLLSFTGVSAKVLTANELLLNPDLNQEVRDRLKRGEKQVHIDARRAAATGEF